MLNKKNDKNYYKFKLKKNIEKRATNDDGLIHR